MSRPIAFFDFDGTITTKDTLLEIIKYRHGKAKFYLGFLLHSPWLVLMKLGLVSNQSTKEKVLKLFFGKMTTEQFRVFCEQFAAEKIPALIRPKALVEIDKLKKAGAEVVIVSASPENWLQPWCATLNLSLMGTQLEVKNDKITGKIKGINCYGEEKVRRIKAAYDLTAYGDVYCYGDTSGDKPMLALARHGFYQPFR
ncbi:HAD family hydrolase [Paraflavitalea sp. CAU 1676]|uniref:HAD family hydrolase n=1 Tax=Paraflavitalea sp. CAU 1676 TaxID=3032598 RepID=UPI0023DB771F|nr:HAD family hydrolase [Paraflavitalea sp. CAU 1676]MDF2187622.1 HAD-IB family hydrolase [Paraflavitalea sp. CAU 1676]